jgi:hypothetical protein
MGRTFETLRRRDPGRAPAGALPARPPVVAPLPSDTTVEPADFDFGTGEVPFIEVGGIAVEESALVVAPAMAASASPTPAPVVERGVRFLPHQGTTLGACEDSDLVILSKPESAEANQYRQVRDALLDAMAKRSVRSLLLTPDGECLGDTAAINLASALAEGSERSVLLIDADPKGTPLAARLGLAAAPGWAELLLGLPIAQVLQQSMCPKLHVIAAGNRLVGARALTRASALHEQLEALARHYDAILVRSPGSTQAAEALALAHACDAVCFLQSKKPSGTPAEPELLSAWQREGIRVLGAITAEEPAPRSE